MFDNSKKKGSGCFSEEELVSYLYGEIGETDRVKLDSHLANCPLCTDEFAGFSESRFSVYEWKRSAFAGLATPEISGPWQDAFAQDAVGFVETRPGSWLSGFLAPILRRPAFAFTAIPILLAVGLLVVFYPNFSGTAAGGGSSDVQISNLAPPEPEFAINELPVTNSPEQKPGRVEKVSRVAANTSDRSMVKPQVAKAVNKRPFRPAIRTEMASTDVVPHVSSGRGKSPRLSDFEDVEDNSVRLSDLFAGADTDR